MDGTEFQQKVWSELINIPYGQVATYKEIAEKIGNKKAFRAVGNANNKNKIAIMIPCHRVIESDGKLTGYAELLIALFSFYGSAACVLNTHFEREFLPVGKPFGIFKK